MLLESYIKESLRNIITENINLKDKKAVDEDLDFYRELDI